MGKKLIFILMAILMQCMPIFGLSGPYKRKLDQYFPSGEIRDFAYAASRGDRKVVKKFLGSGYDINKAGEGGMTPLILSAMLGNRKAVVLLLENGANPNQQSNEGSSAMSWGARSQDIKILEAVLKWGGDVNLRNKKNKSTPLFDAAAPESVENAKLLLKYKPDLDVQNSSGETAMMYAAGLGRYDIVMILLDAGANPRIENNWNNTILYIIQNISQWEGFPQEAERAKVAERLKKSGFWRIEER